jgi:hypothetical protein
MTASTASSTSSGGYSQRLKNLGLQDDKFNSKLIAQDQVTLWSEECLRMRRLISAECADLFTDAQKFSFSNDGNFAAIGSKDGCRISVIEVGTEAAQ